MRAVADRLHSGYEDLDTFKAVGGRGVRVPHGGIQRGVPMDMDGMVLTIPRAGVGAVPSPSLFGHKP